LNNDGFYLIDHRVIALAMVLLLIAVGEMGFRLGSRRQETQESFRSLMSGSGAAMLGLLGLLLGFSLSMAISRWDARREIIVNESNAIGTLWLRAGLLEEPLRGDLRDTLREYTDARIALGGSRGDLDALRAARSKSESLHTLIWSVVERANQPDRSNAVLSSLTTAANELIDIHELRLASIKNFLPAPLFLLLLAVAAVAIGFLAWSFGAANQGGRTAIMMLALLIGAVLMLIMDVNRPQRGRFDVGTDSLKRVGQTMAAPAPCELPGKVKLKSKQKKVGEE
jgi:hypothetical protein